MVGNRLLMWTAALAWMGVGCMFELVGIDGTLSLYIGSILILILVVEAWFGDHP